jgi:hypothetical protein
MSQAEKRNIGTNSFLSHILSGDKKKRREGFQQIQRKIMTGD